MSSTSFARTACRLLAAVAAVSVLNVSAVAKEKEPAAMSDESAIRAAVESYVAAYNRGDAKAVAAHWSDSGRVDQPLRPALRREGRPSRRRCGPCSPRTRACASKCMQPSIRFVSPDVAIEEGTVRVIRPAEPPSDSTYLAVHVKKDGQWKLDTVRETDVPEAPHGQLAAPRPGVAGRASGSTTVPKRTSQATVTWTKNKTFLNYPSRSRRLAWTISKALKSSAGTRRRARSAPGCSIPTADSAKAPGRRRTTVGREVQPGPARRPQGIGDEHLHAWWTGIRLPGNRSAGRWTESSCPMSRK